MDKYIVAKKLYDKLNELGGCGAEPDTYAAGWDDAITAAIDALDDMPAADVEPVKHGKWINTHSAFDSHMRKCSVRKKQLSVLGGPLARCPYYGAKMKGVTK